MLIDTLDKKRIMKKRVLIMVVLFIISLACCSECKLAMDYQYPLRLDNNSGYTIDCFFSIDDEFAPFTPNVIPVPYGYLFRGIKPQEYCKYRSKLEWEKMFLYIKTDTISIYIFHTDTLNKYSWKEICEDYLVLKRYDFSLEDLKRLKYNIPYPPSPIMRDMKMYPPYEDK